MITGIHTLFYSRDADNARAFFRDVIALPFIDSGGGWLLFAAPPAELAVHPEDGDDPGATPPGGTEVYLMCHDIHQTVATLRAKGAEITADVTDEGYGLFTRLRIPGGGEIGLYEPRHPTAFHLATGTSSRTRSRLKSVKKKTAARKSAKPARGTSAAKKGPKRKR
jgi:predicted enzyme related to lactoylglutathione lyase